MVGGAQLFIYDEDWGHYYVVDGTLTRVQVTEEQRSMLKEIQPTFVGPINVLESIARSFADYVQKQGGIDQEQQIIGKADRLLEEVTWLRALIEKQL